MGSIFGALIDGMVSLINLLYGLTVAVGFPSYGVAIILLTILIKMVLYPLTRIQMRSMMQMQLIQPEMQALQKRYAKDKQKLQAKMMELYKERKVNPMAGCLLLLAQMPFLIALYRALWNFPYAHPEHAGFFCFDSFCWVPTLSQPDPLWILPVLAGVTTYFQSKMTMPKTAPAGEENPAQQTQKMMLYVLPAFIFWISSRFAAGLSVYWVTFNLMGIIQQHFINKQLIPAREAALAEVGNANAAKAVEEAEIVEEKLTEERKPAGGKKSKAGSRTQPRSATPRKRKKVKGGPRRRK